MESQIEEVKTRTDIVSLVGNYVSLKKAGRNYRGLCPFHNEKTPSFMVNSERQIFKCFGCNEGGDALAFYQKVEGVDFPTALKYLADKAGIRLAEFTPSPADKQKETVLEINKLATNFFHFLLTKHPVGKKPLAYLKERGINEASIEEWQLGFAPEKWSELYKFLVKKGFSQKDIFTSSLALPSTGKGAYDRFRKRIIFPIYNLTGAVVGFSGRIFGEGEPKYLNSPDSLVFNKSNNLFGLYLAKSEIKKQNQAVLVEGNLDVLSSYQAGVKNVVAPLGTALTEKQVELIRRFAENLVISFDQDQAGEKASLRAVELAEKAGLNIKLIELKAKDPDELIKENPKAWREAIEKASSIYDYSLNNLVKRYGTSTPEAISKITREIIPLIAKIDNQISRSHYERLLASKLDVSEDAIRKEISRVAKSEVLPEKKENDSKPLNEKEKLEKYLLLLVVQGETLPENLRAEDFSNRDLRIIFELIYKKAVDNKFKIKDIEKLIPEEHLEIFNELSLGEIEDNSLLEEEKLQKEFQSCTLRLKELNLRTELKKIGLALKQAEATAEDDKVQELSINFKKLSEELGIVEKEKENLV